MRLFAVTVYQYFAVSLALLGSLAVAVSGQNTSTSPAIYYVNSTTLPPVVNPTRSSNLTGSYDSLFPGTNISAQVSTIFAAGLNRTASPGGALLIHTPSNGSYFQSFGKDAYNSSTAFNLSNRFRIASNTKTFTGSAILKLASEGKLSLNDVSDLNTHCLQDLIETSTDLEQIL